jgi:hypothetical protein
LFFLFVAFVGLVHRLWLIWLIPLLVFVLAVLDFSDNGVTGTICGVAAALWLSIPCFDLAVRALVAWSQRTEKQALHTSAATQPRPSRCCEQ